MRFEPKPGMQINLGGEPIQFTSLEERGPASIFVYAESGKESTVYRVLKNREYFALKVFYPDYQDKRLLINTEKLLRLKNMSGMRVAERTIITSNAFPEILERYPELNYSVLMPWIEGMLWGNLMVDNRLLQPEQYFQIALFLMKVVCNLESRGLAHCDLSNNNFIINQNLSSVELIDLEDMYAPDMPSPVPDISYGTPGYRSKWIAKNGLWGRDSDRFASAILCAEIITRQYKEIRENKAGDSFFDEDEIGENSERYQLMKDALGNLSSELSSLFQTAWFSEQPNQCPSVCEWQIALLRLTNGITPGKSEEILRREAEEKVRPQAEEKFRREAETMERSEKEMVRREIEERSSQREMEQRARRQKEEEVARRKMEKSSKEKAEHENRRTQLAKKLKISVAYPKLLSKRFESSFLLQIYLPKERSQVARSIKSEFRDQKTNEYMDSSSAKTGQKIKVKFFSPYFIFSDPEPKLVAETLTEIILSGTPTDNCEPGVHTVSVSLSDFETGLGIDSKTVKVQVVDFAFDHVSRPFISKTASIFLFIGSFVMFFLTLFEQIDKTAGLTSGTAAAAIAIVIYNNFYSLFQRVRPNTP